MRPIIYQTLPRLFGANSVQNIKNGSKEQNGCGKLNDYTVKALNQIRGLGCNYIWYTGIIEHATQTDYSAYGIRPDNPFIVKGKAGSPYAIKDYYDIDPDLAVEVPQRMKEFERLVSRTHRAGLKMLIDFVPNHVARQYHSDSKPAGVNDLGEQDDTSANFSPQNNFYYLPGQHLDLGNICDNTQSAYDECPAKVTGNDCFSARPGRNDWYETIKLNYGIDPYTHHLHPSAHHNIPDTWNKMADILRFWATKGIDGFRCDMAEMVPVEFWGWVIPQIKSEHPDIIFIAEVYNPNEYHNYIHRGHFDYLYDKVGLYDTLRHVMGGGSASLITGCWQAVDDINGHMLNFLENHDEQRIASDFFAKDPLRGRPALLVSALMRTNPFMLYQGQTLGADGMEDAGFSGSDGRTTIFDYWTVSQLRRWRNGNKFDGDLLTHEEQQLHAYYRQVLTLCNNEPAIRQGQFYDLMYANHDNELMNTDRLFAFIRKSGNETILVVANFEAKEQEAAVNIPAHAFDFLSLKQGSHLATDLLTQQTQTINLLPDQTTTLTVPALNGIVLKL